MGKIVKFGDFLKSGKTAISGLSVGFKREYTGPQKRATLAQIFSTKSAKFAGFAHLARGPKMGKNDHKER